MQDFAIAEKLCFYIYPAYWRHHWSPTLQIYLRCTNCMLSKRLTFVPKSFFLLWTTCIPWYQDRGVALLWLILLCPIRNVYGVLIPSSVSKAASEAPSNLPADSEATYPGNDIHLVLCYRLMKFSYPLCCCALPLRQHILQILFRLEVYSPLMDSIALGASLSSLEAWKSKLNRS